MRLTLRTLLAYLDDILDPTQTKQLGEKVNESEYASVLIARIREVIRRRRLGAPDLSGPGMGLDPNIVAEYLDNTLGANGVQDVEKVCLESDVHLAEVAACHQILTLVLGEPVEIVPESRERMYALGPLHRPPQPDTTGGTDQNKARAAAPEAPSRQAVAAVVPARNPSPSQGAEPEGNDQSAPRPQRFEDSIPDYLRASRGRKRVLPYLLVLVGVVAFAALILTDKSMRELFPVFQEGNEATVADDSSAVTHPQAVPVPQGAAVSGTAIRDANQAAVTTPPVGAGPTGVPVTTPGTAVVVGVKKTTETASIDPPPPPDEPETVARSTKVTANGGKVTAMLPGTGKVTIDPGLPGTKTPPTVVTLPSKVALPKGPLPADTKTTTPAVPAMYQSTRGVLLLYDVQEKDWKVLPHRSMIQPDDTVAALEPFDAALEFGKGRATAVLVGGTTARSLRGNDAGEYGLDLLRGRLVLQPGQAGGTPASTATTPPATLALAVQGRLARVELMSLDTKCGVEVILPHTVPAPPPANTTAAPQAWLHVVTGSVRYSDGMNVHVVGPQSSLQLLPTVVAMTGETMLPRPSVAWLEVENRLPTAAVQRSAGLFERELGAEQKVLFNLPGVLINRNPSIAEFAAKALSLLQAYPQLVEALAQTEHEEVRRAAISGLMQWLHGSAENGVLLKTELERVFSKPDVEIVNRLLRGISRADASDLETSQRLIDWLDHEHIAIRELAYYHFIRYSSRRYSYRPLYSAVQRRPIIERMRAQVTKDGGILPRPSTP